MHELVNAPLAEKSIVTICSRADDAVLDQIPLFRIAEEFLKIIQREKQIKLTPLGALPKKIVVELYEKRFLLDDLLESGFSKLWREEDCISIMSMRHAVELARLVRKSRGRLTLTKKGTELLKAENRLGLFKEFLLSFTNLFAWSFNDGYTREPIGQIGWAFLIYMLDKFGEQGRDVEFYASKYLNAFPEFISCFTEGPRPAKEGFIHCYGVRAFERFLVWFGLVIVSDRSLQPMADFTMAKYRRSDVFQKVFCISTKG